MTNGTTLAPGPQKDRPLDKWGNGRRLDVVIGLLLAAMAATFVLMSVANGPRLSLYDESTHIDYAYRASQFELPRTGQELSRYTLDQWSCRGRADAQLPPCGAETPAAEYPAQGTQYNAFHPPVYYFVTGVPARALATVTGVDFTTAARSIGAVWLWAAMFGLYLTLRFWRLRVRYSLAAAFILPLIPGVLHASSTVTNDAPAALCGVAALFILGRVVLHRNTGYILPAVLAGAAASTKIMNSLAPLIVAAVFGLVALVLWKRSGWKSSLPVIRVAGAMVLAIVVVYGGWGAVQSSRTPPGYSSPIEGISSRDIAGLPFDEWSQAAMSGTSLVNDFYLDPAVSSRYIGAWGAVLNLLLAVAPFTALVLYRRGTPRWLVGGTTLLGMFSFPMIVQLEVLKSNYSYFPIVTPRYGMTLIPLAVASLAILAERKRLGRSAVGFLAIGFIVMLTSTAGLFA
ncbi:MAG: hypothetical protein WBF71_17050 [Microthrixaceae bacterium]